jgi:hypothetical protein
MVGRGTRRHFGKASCLVLDLVGVGHRFDLATLPDLVTADVPHALGAAGAAAVRRAVQQGRAVVGAIADAFAAQAIEFRESVLNLFASGRLRWVEIASDRFEVTLGEGRTLVVARLDADWIVSAVGGDMPGEIWRGPSVEYARGAAEQYVARLGDAVELPGYAYRGRWCDEPATEKQRALLGRYGVPTAGLTKGEASARIAQLMRQWGRTA